MKPIEMSRYEPSRENPGRLEYAGQRTAQELFAELEYRLKNAGYLPDEYFLLDHEWENGKEIPKDAYVFCTTDFGASEGIYTDIYLKWVEDGKPMTKNFATGKTLGESGTDLDRMNLIASAITKAFHEEGVHARYIIIGSSESNSTGSVLHLNEKEQRVLIDSLIESRERLMEETNAVEHLLRRVTGSITEFVNEVGARPLNISEYDRAVLAIQDGNLSAFKEACANTQITDGSLLAYAAGRPGDVGKKMTMLLLAGKNSISNEDYLTICKNAMATGDTDRVLLLANEAPNCVAGLDKSLYGKLICECLLDHKKQIADVLVQNGSREQISAAPPYLLIQALHKNDTQMAMQVIEKGINANACAAEMIKVLKNNQNDWMFKHFYDRGMQIDCMNYCCRKLMAPCESV